MKSTLFLRLASALTFLHAVLHTVGGVFGKPAPGAAQAAMLAMQTSRFHVMGVTRTYADFLLGSGLAISILLLVESIVFWQLGTLSKTDAPGLRPILAAFLAGYLALAVNSYQLFFAAPVIAELVIALCLGLAIVTSKPAVSTGPVRP